MIDFTQPIEEIQRQIRERDTANGVYGKQDEEHYPAAATHGGAAIQHKGE